MDSAVFLPLESAGKIRYYESDFGFAAVGEMAAAELNAKGKERNGGVLMVLYIVLFLVVLALCYVLFNFLRIRRMREGTDVMVEMAGIIRSGATAFLETEFKTIAIVVVVLAAIFSLFIEATSGITFLFGA